MSKYSKKANIVKANRLLQAKTGTGQIREEAIEASQQIIDENEIDFRPMAAQFLAELEAAITEARKGEKNTSSLLSGLITPVMQLKGNASMFNYNLVGNLATIVLDFLEALDDVNPDVLQIVDAHHKTLSRIISDKVTGEGGAFGQELATELKQACQRYFTKHNCTSAAIQAPDVFFVD